MTASALLSIGADERPLPASKSRERSGTSSQGASDSRSFQDVLAETNNASGRSQNKVNKKQQTKSVTSEKSDDIQTNDETVVPATVDKQPAPKAPLQLSQLLMLFSSNKPKEAEGTESDRSSAKEGEDASSQQNGAGSEKAFVPIVPNTMVPVAAPPPEPSGDKQMKDVSALPTEGVVLTPKADFKQSGSAENKPAAKTEKGSPVPKSKDEIAGTTLTQSAWVPLIEPASKGEDAAPMSAPSINPAAGKQVSGNDNKPAPETASTATPAHASQAAPHLSFGMRLQAEQGTAKQSEASREERLDPRKDDTRSEIVQEQTPRPSEPRVSFVAAAAKSSEARNESVRGSNAMPAVENLTPPRVADERNSTQPEMPRTAATVEAEPTPAHANEAVRTVQVQLAGEQSERVNLKLMDTGGELRVSVRTSDPALAQKLQEHMPELTSRLEGQHYRTEVWTPRVTASEQSSESNSGSSSSQTGSSRQEQDGSGKRQNSRQNQPDWFEDLES